MPPISCGCVHGCNPTNLLNAQNSSFENEELTSLYK